MVFTQIRGKKRFEILIFFSLWKSLLPLEQKQSYDCNVCRAKGDNEKRYCFLDSDKLMIPLPSKVTMDEERGMPLIDSVIKRNTTADNFLDGIFNDFSNAIPDQPPFQLLQDLQGILGWKKELCVTGLMEESYMYIMELYETCKLYNVLPKSGGVEDQIPKVMTIFKVLESEAIKFEKIRQDSKGKK